MSKRFSIPLLHRYLLGQFLTSFFGCLFAFSSLFLMFDFFDKVKTFIQEGSTFLQATSYLLFKIPFILHLMTPIAMLVATILAVGRLSQLSEITAMRACGMSVFWIARPLIAAGLVVSLLMFVAGETIVPWSTEYVEELYHVDIKKKAEKGAFNKENFWYRSENRFVNVGLYDSKTATLKDVSILEMDPSFRLKRRTDAAQAKWHSPTVGWTMKDVAEMNFDEKNRVSLSTFKRVPLIINERPEDFYNMQRRPESLSYRELSSYIAKLSNEGVPVTKYSVDLASKISFPFVNAIVVLIALPFALTPARSRTLTVSFIAGVSIGFGYYFVHALSTSLGGAELLPVLPSAWAANIILGCVGGFLMGGAEYH